MLFHPLYLQGAYLIEIEKKEDERGFFARTFCQSELTAKALCSYFPQSSLSFNKKKGTLRGMHFQAAPYEEVKIVQCVKGAIFDVIIDLRPNSNTYKKWIGIELSVTNRYMLYIPAGFAHGFQTLQDESEVFYHISVPYVPEVGRGVRWDDPTFEIEWPLGVEMISEKDQGYPFLNEHF